MSKDETAETAATVVHHALFDVLEHSYLLGTLLSGEANHKFYRHYRKSEHDRYLRDLRWDFLRWRERVAGAQQAVAGEQKHPPDRWRTNTLIVLKKFSQEFADVIAHPIWRRWDEPEMMLEGVTENDPDWQELSELLPRGYRSFCADSVQVYLSIIELRKLYPSVPLVSDEARSSCAWASRCEHAAEVESWALRHRMGDPPKQTPKWSEWYKAHVTIQRSYTAQPISLRYLKGAIEYYERTFLYPFTPDVPYHVSQQVGVGGTDKNGVPFCRDEVRVIRVDREKDPAQEKNIAKSVIHFFKESIALDLPDAPEFPTATSMTPVEALGALERLRASCIRKIDASRNTTSLPETDASIASPAAAENSFMRLEDIRGAYPDLTEEEIERIRKRLEYWGKQHEDKIFKGEEDPSTGRRRYGYPRSTVEQQVTQERRKRPKE